MLSIFLNGIQQENVSTKDSLLAEGDGGKGVPLIKEKALYDESIGLGKLFTTLEEKKEELPFPEILKIRTEWWQTVVLVIVLFLLGFAKLYSNGRFKQMMKSLVNYTVSQEISREEKVFFHGQNLLLTFVHVLMLALFIFHLRNSLSIGIDSVSTGLIFISLVGFVVLVYISKYIGARLLFFVFDDVSISTEYVFNVSLYNNLLAVLLIPMMCIYYFAPFNTDFLLFYFTTPIIALVILWRLVRLFKIGLVKGISYFYIFLYICTLEIIPLVVLLRIFIIK